MADRPRLRYAISRQERTRILGVVDPRRPHLLQDTPVEIGILLLLADFGSVPRPVRVFLGGIHARAYRAFWLLRDRRKLGHLQFLLVSALLLRFQQLLRSNGLESGHSEIRGPFALSFERVEQLWMAQLLAFLECCPCLFPILGSGFLLV